MRPATRLRACYPRWFEDARMNLLTAVGLGALAVTVGSGQWNLHIVQRCWHCGGLKRVPMRPPPTLLESLSRPVVALLVSHAIGDIAGGVAGDAGASQLMQMSVDRNTRGAVKDAIVTSRSSATHFACANCGDVQAAAGWVFEVVNGCGCLTAFVALAAAGFFAWAGR